MKARTRIATLLLVVAGLGTGQVMAAPGPFADRIADSRRLIERGSDRGHLDAGETRELRRLLASIVHARRAHLADGGLNHAERRDLDRRLDRLEGRVARHLRPAHREDRRHESRRDDRGHESRRDQGHRDSVDRHRAPPRHDRRGRVYSYGPPPPGMSGYGFYFRPAPPPRRAYRNDREWRPWLYGWGD